MSDMYVNEPVFEATQDRWRIRFRDASGRYRSVYAKKESKARLRYEEIRRELDTGAMLINRISFIACAKEALEERSLLVGKKKSFSCTRDLSRASSCTRRRASRRRVYSCTRRSAFFLYEKKGCFLYKETSLFLHKKKIFSLHMKKTFL